MLVRRPAKRRHFSGNVVVEMLNPSNLFDLNIGWALSHDQFMRNGDVWVGITAKPIAVAALMAFDLERYRPLSFANPLPLTDPRNCTDIQTVVDPPELRSRATEDGLIWDINSQVGAWLRSGETSNPLADGRTLQAKLFAEMRGRIGTLLEVVDAVGEVAIGSVWPNLPARMLKSARFTVPSLFASPRRNRNRNGNRNSHADWTNGGNVISTRTPTSFLRNVTRIICPFVIRHRRFAGNTARATVVR